MRLCLRRKRCYRKLVGEFEEKMAGGTAAAVPANTGSSLQLHPPEAFGTAGEAAGDAVTWVVDHLEGDPPKPHDASPFAWALYTWASTNASTKKAFLRYVFTSVVPTRGTLPEQRPDNSEQILRNINALREECKERERKGLHPL